MSRIYGTKRIIPIDHRTYNVSRNTYKPTYKPNPKPSYNQLYLDITSYN